MMIDELLEIAADLAATTRAYLCAQDRGYDTAHLRERLEAILQELANRNM